MEEKLIAPCGMNCGVCISYLAMKNELKKKGFAKKYCPGCLPRGKKCTFMAKHCNLLGKGLVRFCYKCENFPCRRLKNLDKRYRTKYHMSMIENLEFIKEHGIKEFLEKEETKRRCLECGGVICFVQPCVHSSKRVIENEYLKYEVLRNLAMFFSNSVLTIES